MTVLAVAAEGDHSERLLRTGLLALGGRRRRSVPERVPRAYLVLEEEPPPSTARFPVLPESTFMKTSRTAPDPGPRRLDLLLAATLFVILPLHLQAQSPAPDGGPELQSEIEVLLELGDTAEAAGAYLRLADAYEAAGRLTRAEEALRDAIVHMEALADTAGLAAGHNRLGMSHWRHARYDSAVVHLERARVLWVAAGDRGAQGRALNNLGATHFQWGNYEPALDAFLRSLELRREVGDERGQALVMVNIGRTYHDWQQYERSRTVLQGAIEAANAVGDPFVQGYALHNMGILHLSLGEYDEARELFEASLRFYGSEDPRLSESEAASGWALNIAPLGLVHIRNGEVERGVGLIREALETAAREGQSRRRAPRPGPPGHGVPADRRPRSRHRHPPAGAPPVPGCRAADPGAGGAFRARRCARGTG